MAANFPPLPDLPAELVELVMQVPSGKACTYGDLARALGDLAACRWVGQMLLDPGFAAECPSHRVVRTGGDLGRFHSGDVSEKAKRLTAEGVRLKNQQTVDWDRHGFDDFVGKQPLRRLANYQDNLRAEISLKSRFSRPSLVAGVDVSYVPSTNEGVAAYALCDATSGELLWQETHRARVAFPYISSYLAFRELPLVLGLLDRVEKAGKMAQVILVDGAGVAHPRGAGVASQLGVVADLPTIGITKKRLFGRMKSADLEPGMPMPLLDGRRNLGAALLPHTGTARPMYVSPGHLVSVKAAVAVASRLLLRRRNPEPIYWADRLSRQAAREFAQP
jgi:deoxyribonuclease V